jgi:hypothetical protein
MGIFRLKRKTAFVEMGMTRNTLKSALKSQYHAGLAMLRQSVELCPEALWADTDYVNDVWQIAYHTLFFTHLYMQPSLEDFEPWEHQQSDVQYPDAIGGPPKPESDLPLLPNPYSKQQVLAYCQHCDRMVDETVDLLDLDAPECGFWWYDFSKLEHQIINIRHLQHGVAQMTDRIRSVADVGVAWVGASRSAEY